MFPCVRVCTSRSSSELSMLISWNLTIAYRDGHAVRISFCYSWTTEGENRSGQRERERTREEEKIVEVEFFDHGSIFSLYVIDHVKRQEAINVLSSSSTLDWTWQVIFFSVCVQKNVNFFYMIITFLCRPLFLFFSCLFSLFISRAFILLLFLLSIVRHSVEFCCPWRINKRWVCACRWDLSMRIYVCVYARQRFLFEMIRRTVVYDTRKTNQSIEWTNVELFKLIIKFDNKSLDQIERVRVRTYLMLFFPRSSKVTGPSDII